MARYRMRPQQRKQALPDSCWAAALDEFSRITPGVPRLREADLVGSWGIGATGGLNRINLFGLNSSQLAPAGVHLAFDFTPVMPYAVEDRLQDSHVILFRHIARNSWHAWLVYGIDNWVIYMDPRDGGHHKMRWASSRFISGRGYYFVWQP